MSKVKVKTDPVILTAKQVAYLCNRPEPFVHHKKKTELSLCYPFPHKEEGREIKESGPVFIIKDEKLKTFIDKYGR